MTRIRSALAALLAASLVLLSPGLEAYRIFAEGVVEAPVQGAAGKVPGFGVPVSGAVSAGANTAASGSASLGQANRFNGRFHKAGLPPLIYERRAGVESAVDVAVPQDAAALPRFDAAQLIEIQRDAELAAGNGVAPSDASKSADKSFSLLQKLGLRKKTSEDAGNGTASPPQPSPRERGEGGRRERIERAYTAGKSVRNRNSALALSGMAALTAAAGYTAVHTVGLSALHSSALLLAGLIFVPSIAQEMINRWRHKTPEETPLLSKEEHPEIYAEVKELSARAGIEMPKLLYWDMDAPNAAAMGFHLPLRVTRSTVLFTRSILEIMPPAALAGVVGHELSHVRQNDLLWTIGAKLTHTTLFLTAMSAHLHPALFVGAVVTSHLLQDYIGRQREYLADLGGARLVRSPAPLASGLLRLDIWSRMVAGAGGPVNRFDPGRLLQDHPSTLSRAETLLAMARRVGHTAARGVAAPLAAYAAVFTKLTVVPAIVSAYIAGGPLWAGVLAAQYAFLKGLLALNRAMRPVDDQRMKRDIGTYLSHPDPQIRAAVAGALGDFVPQDFGELARLRAVVAAAAERESSPAIKKSLMTAVARYRQAEDSMRAMLRFAQAQARLVMSRVVLRAVVEKRIKDVPPDALAEALALLPAASRKVKGTTLPGQGDVVKVAFHLVDAGPRAPPALAAFQAGSKVKGIFWHVDAEKGEAWIAAPLWDALKPEQRAALLFHLTALIEAQKAAGDAWVEGTPETDAAARAIASATPGGVRSRPTFLRMKGQAMLEKALAERGGPRPSLTTRLYHLAVALWQKAEDTAMGSDAASGERSPSADRWTALGFGVFSAVALTLMTGWAGFPLGLINYFTALRFINLGWKKTWGWRLKPLAWLAPSAALELTAIHFGVPLVGGALWWAQSFLAAYLLKRHFALRSGPSWAAVGISVTSIFVLGLKLVALHHASALIAVLALSALFMHLARYGRISLPIAAGVGAGLVGLFVGAALLVGPGYAGVAVALAAHVLGKRLTKGAKPTDTP